MPVDYSKWDDLDTASSSGYDTDDRDFDNPREIEAPMQTNREVFNDPKLLRCGLLDGKGDPSGAVVCRERLAEGADPTSCNRMGQTALHIAAIWDGREVGALLVEAGADVNARNMMGGGTPLMAAAHAGQTEFAKMLLACGADPKMQDEYGRFPWQMSKNDELRVILGGPSAELTDAAREGDVDAFIEVATAKPKLLGPGARDSSGNTPLIIAIRYKHFEIADWLCAHDWAKGFVNLYGAGGDFPLHLAVRAENATLVEKLLAAGANPNAKSVRDNEYTNGRYEKLDPETGKKVTISDEHRTALFDCAVNGNAAIARLLIDGGCDLDAVDGDGCTALYVALDEAAETEDPGTRKRLFHVAELLLEAGASPDIGNADIGTDNTLLAWASSCRNQEAVQLILRFGANPNLPGKSGMYPIHMAARVGDVAILKMLRAAGANVEVKTISGHDAMHIAERGKKEAFVAALREA
jgi:ankyrin repeat protein